MGGRHQYDFLVFSWLKLDMKSFMLSCPSSCSFSSAAFQAFQIVHLLAVYNLFFQSLDLHKADKTGKESRGRARVKES